MNGTPRYWCPLTGRIALDAGGFLADPRDPFGFDQTLSTYDEADQHRCLVLLGEPGIGKTTELERAVVLAGARAHRVDLGAVADPEGLRRQVIEAPAVTAWREGDGELFMFLDAFDR
jgi:replication-associated recombination protein RarA